MKKDEELMIGGKIMSSASTGEPGVQRTRPKLQGHRLVTSWSTIAAQSSKSRLVLGLLGDGQTIQLQVQDMRPRFFEVGLNRRECLVYMDEHGKLMATIRRLKQTPVERWMEEYRHIRLTKEPEISADRKLVYLCMAENLQVCWRSLLCQLEDRWRLLCASCEFYDSLERLARDLDEAEARHQLLREGSMVGVSGGQLGAMLSELRSIERRTSADLQESRSRRDDLIKLISAHASENLGDSRQNLVASEAKSLIVYIARCLELVERRKLQVDSSLASCLSSINNRDKMTKSQQPLTGANTVQASRLGGKLVSEVSTVNDGDLLRTDSSASHVQEPLRVVSKVHEINNFNDLHSADNWLCSKIQQLNSSSLCSLGLSIADSRAILNKHEQIALECRTIEEATLTFAGKSIHAVKPQQVKASNGSQTMELLEQQKQLADKTRDVITILGARLVLLRRTIDFYLRASEASEEVGRLVNRLQFESSLQSVQFVASELELRDVSSVVASGATIISELQQLQLAQQQGQRSSLVSLSLVTSGIRLLIDRLNQELAQLKSLLSQRRLILMNEDSAKIADNILLKCSQLHSWVKLHVKGYLMANNTVGLDAVEARAFCEAYEQLRLELQNNTCELEALLRLQPSLADNLGARGEHMAKVHEAIDGLRQEWIGTSCLDARIELVRRYVQLLHSLDLLAKEIQLLEGISSGRHTAPERTHEDINLNIEQTIARLTNEVRKFELDASKHDTELAADVGHPASDLNKVELIGHLRHLLADLETDRRRIIEQRPLESREPEQTASQRQQQQLPPRFTRPLTDQQVEPFSCVELECETDTADCQVDWFMGNFRRIPASIKHQVSSEGQIHRLTIQQFSPVCCGSYVARASNGAGQVMSQCRLRLLGIKEDLDNEQPIEQSHKSLTEGHQGEGACNKTMQATGGQEDSWQGAKFQTSADSSESLVQVNQVETSRHQMSRLIQGVEQRDPTEELEGKEAGDMKLPVTRVTYAGPGARLEVPTSRYTVESPLSSASLPVSRSVSKSPSLVGTPQAPVFVQELRDTLVRSQSRAGLVCLVVGNPPPTIEWLHNNQSIATTKCQTCGSSNRANICKLTIKTMNPLTQGQYVCRAYNKIGQSSTDMTLSK